MHNLLLGGVCLALQTAVQQQTKLSSLSPHLRQSQPRSRAVGEMAWQLLPLPENWQYQSNFRMLSHDNSKPAIVSCSLCFIGDHLITLVQMLCEVILLQRLLLRVVDSRTCIKPLLPRAGKLCYHSWKNLISIICRFKLYMDVTSQ